ncbi:MAG: hypothetical protein KIS77_19730 [Saprospiraceae bacterium]|nr:hypothetical protein [Saprospiraceae bacterium]
MKKLFFTLALVLGCYFAAFSQKNYTNAIGLRLGYPTSITYKHFISEPGAIEVFAGFRSYSGYGWFNAAAAYEHHFDISGVDGLNWYAGGGVSAFFWNDRDNIFVNNRDYKSTSIGVFGVIGLDYKFANAPLNLSVDWMPLVFLNGYGSGFGGGYGALSARYVLN